MVLRPGGRRAPVHLGDGDRHRDAGHRAGRGRLRRGDTDLLAPRPGDRLAAADAADPGHRPAGRLPLPWAGGLRGDPRGGRRRRSRGRDRRRPARARGGARGGGPGRAGDRRPPDGPADGAPARPGGGGDAGAGDGRPRRGRPARAPDDVAARQRPRPGAHLRRRRVAGRRPRRGLDRHPPRGRPGPQRPASPRSAGIVVDDRMRTSAAGVVAVGECAEHRGTVYGLVAPIHEQAKVAADTLLRAARAGLRRVDPVGQAQGDGRRPRLDRRGRGRPVGDRRVPRGPDLPQAGAARRQDQRGDPARRHPRAREPARGRARRRARQRPAGPAGRGQQRDRRPTCRTPRRSATATASARARSSRRSTTGCRRRAR